MSALWASTDFDPGGVIFVRHRRTVVRATLALLVLGGGVVAGTTVGEAAPAADVPLAWTAPKALDVQLAGSNGESRVRGDGLDCEGEEPVDDVHLLLSAPVPGGTLSSLLATANTNLGLAGHRLEPTTSHAALGDERGTVRFRLDGGACPGPNLPNPNLLAPDGNGALAGTGPLALVGSTGSYRSATLASGTWSLTAAVDPGADNAWNLRLAGQLRVLAPGLQVERLAAYWGNLGLDYVVRIVTVQYRITNPGPGDSYGSALTAASASPGVVSLGPLPQPLGDLLAGESRIVTLRYQLGLLQPCQLVILGCNFQTTLTASLPDALDAAGSRSATVGVTAPNLPPPL